MGDKDLSRRVKILSTAGVMLALLLASLDQTVVGTALPRIVAELNGLDRYSWLVTGYLVSSTVTTPISGKLGDLFGRKPFLIAGMVGFVLASALCGLAPTMTALIGFRILQGLFAGILFSSAFTVIADIFPPAQRARLQGVFGGVFGISSIVGPLVGGFLTDNWGWRWVFYVNLPIGILGVAVVAAFLPFVRTRASWRDIDFWGAGALAASLIPLLVALSTARGRGWTSPVVLGLLVFAAAMLVAFVLIERRTAQPIVPLGLFRNRVFAVSILVAFLTSVGLFSMIVFVPLELQGVLAASVTNSGLLLTPMMAGLIVASVISGNLMVRIKRYRFLGTAGIALMSAGIYFLALTTTATPQFRITLEIIMVGLGLGLTMPLYLNVVQSALPVQFLGVASSQIQFWRTLGGTVSTAILGTVLAHRLPGAIQNQVSKLNLPPGFQLPASASASNPNASLDPGAVAAAKANLPPAFAPIFDQVMHAIRQALALTLHDLFLVAVTFTALALIASLFLQEVPLRAQRLPAAGEAPEPQAQIA